MIHRVTKSVPVLELTKRFCCDFESGILFHRNDTKHAFAGRVAGCLKRDGYVSVKIDKKDYLVHRIIWAMYHGTWPRGFLDHKDCNRQNNSICNLREANPRQNCANRAKIPNRSSRMKGVSWHRKIGKWQAQIKHCDKSYYLGVFDTEADAHAAYASKAKQLFGDFARAV